MRWFYALLVWFILANSISGCQRVCSPAIEVVAVSWLPGGWWAVVRGPSRWLLIYEGQMLGDYRVVRIDRRGVVFGFRQMRFFMRS